MSTQRKRAAKKTKTRARAGKKAAATKPAAVRGRRLTKKELAEFPPAGSPAGTPTRSKGAVNLGAKGNSTMRSVALDLGSKKIAYCEVSGDEVLERVTVDSIAALERWLGPEREPACVAIEACREAWFVHGKLTEWGNEVLLVDTTRSRKLGIGQHRRKNDKIDAETMAFAVERGGIPLAHMLSPHRQALRRQLGVRRALVETRAQYITTMRGLAREYGRKLPTCDAENFVTRVRNSDTSPEVQATIEPLLATLESLEVQLGTVEQQLDELLVAEPMVAQLTTVPGVGRIVAASFVSVIDEAKRFHSVSRQRLVHRNFGRF